MIESFSGKNFMFLKGFRKEYSSEALNSLIMAHFADEKTEARGG